MVAGRRALLPVGAGLCLSHRPHSRPPTTATRKLISPQWSAALPGPAQRVPANLGETEVDSRAMTRPRLSIVATGLLLALGLAGCTNPYDPAQRTLGGGLLGAGTGA